VILQDGAGVGIGPKSLPGFEMPGSPARGGVAIRHPGGDFGRLQPDLPDHAGLVPDQPFLDDHVALDPAIGDGPNPDRPPGGGPEHARAGVNRDGAVAVGGQEPGGAIVGPDHFLRQEAAVREGVKALERALDHRLDASDGSHPRVHQAVGPVVAADQADAAALPDALGDADNIARKRLVLVAEAVLSHP
jgi:hypothetical protein